MTCEKAAPYLDTSFYYILCTSSGGINASIIAGASFWGEKTRINAGAGYKFQGYEMTGNHKAIHSFVISPGITFR